MITVSEEWCHVTNQVRNSVSILQGEDMGLTARGLAQNVESRQITTNQDTYRQHDVTPRSQTHTDSRPAG